MSQNLPRGWTADAPHLHLIAQSLDRVTRGEIDRLAIFLPPRHAKTQTVTVRYPVYRLQQSGGDMRVLITGYNERFARRLSRRARTIAEPLLSLASDKSAADEWEVPGKGMVMSRGVGSPPTGEGFQLILIDDPIRRREDAESPAMKEKMQDWYVDDIYTRLEPGGAIVLIQTRWAHDDLGEYAPALEPGRWTVLNLPALAEGDNDPLGRTEGEPLWADRYNAKALADIRQVLEGKDPLSWLSLYQQRPAPREGSIFHPDKLREGTPPSPQDFVRLCRGWDKAASPVGNWTVGGLLGETKDEALWLLHVERFREEPSARDKRIRETADADAALYGKGKVVQRGPQDPGQAGVVDAQAFLRLLAGHNVKVERVTGSKELRATPFASQVNAGRVQTAVGAWLPGLKERLRAFKGGANDVDDEIDALADAFTELTYNRSWGTDSRALDALAKR